MKNPIQLIYQLILIWIVWSISAIGLAATTLTITDYQPVFIPGFDTKGDLQIAFRYYVANNQSYFLTVDPHTLVTKTLQAHEFMFRHAVNNVNSGKKIGYLQRRFLEKTPYFKLLKRYSAGPYPLQNYGITHLPDIKEGYVLSVDLCPSRRNFERDFFNRLVEQSKRSHRPQPVAFAITGLWLLQHPDEFSWLVAQAQKGYLDITWVNHSFSHVYYADESLDKNFLLAPETPFEQEVLLTEKLLLANHQLPSVFFRFPGLVANQALVASLHRLGLLPLGSDAWLAKGQMPIAGSVILIHGNGNEPQGIVAAQRWLSKQSSEVPWLPLGTIAGSVKK